MAAGRDLHAYCIAARKRRPLAFSAALRLCRGQQHVSEDRAARILSCRARRWNGLLAAFRPVMSLGISRE